MMGEISPRREAITRHLDVGLIVVPQVAVAIGAWVGFHSEKEGGGRCF